MSTLAYLPRQEKPALLIIVEEPTRHIRSFWAIQKPPFSYAKRTALEGHIVAFSCGSVAGDTPLTITISNDWWEIEDRPVPSQHMAASEVIKLRPEDHIIPKTSAVVEQARILLACIALLALAHPPLTAPYLPPAAAYTLLSARAPAWNWDAPLGPLMRWIRPSLYQA